MKKSCKNFVLAATSAAILAGVAGSAQAANWLFLQGTERPGAAPRAKVWGFIQPEYQSTVDTKLKAGPWKGQKAVFNQSRPQLKTSSSFNVLRARIGVRGVAMPLDSNVNYFFLAEFGNNGITAGGGGAVKLTDASVTFNHMKGARIRIGQFKTPGSEEGLQAIHVFDYINFSNATNGLLLERFFNSDGSTQVGANKPNGSVSAFRDIGIQMFETFKVNNWEHSYAIMVGNGNGINRNDNNDNKELYAYWSSELVYGGKGPRRQGMKLFAWYQDGQRTLAAGPSQTVQNFDRMRSGLGFTYRKGKHRAAAEYINADGMIFTGTDGAALPGAVSNNGALTASWNMATKGKADGWYVHYGFAPTPKWEIDFRYDVYNRLTNSTLGERKFDTATLGLQYFFNKKTRVTINYEFRNADAPGYAGSSPVNQILDSLDDRVSFNVLAIF